MFFNSREAALKINEKYLIVSFNEMLFFERVFCSILHVCIMKILYL